MSSRSCLPRVRVLGRALAVVVAFVVLCVVGSCLGGVPSASAQTVSARGFVDLRGALFPQDTPNDRANLVGDLLVRAEGFAKPTPSLQFAGGIDVRGNTHDQVASGGGLELGDRGLRRPLLTPRRLSATFARGPITIDVGKQFVRWGKTDIVTPTDRLAPRDFLDVLNPELLPISAVRAGIQKGSHTLDAAWLPWFTPSRMPLLDQQWTPTSTLPAAVRLEAGQAVLPTRSQVGVRWSRMSDGYEYAVSFFDGFNNAPTLVPTIEALPAATVPAGQTAGAPVLPGPSVPPVPPVQVVRLDRRYQALRTYGADLAVPTRWLTITSEAALFTAPDANTDEFVLYVVQLERQLGEWLLVGGYAGEIVTERRGVPLFMPERGMTRSIIGRAAYTIDPRRTASVEAAVRQDGAGLYAKGEVSETRGQHWRMTMSAVLLRGESHDFVGQFRRNSHLAASLRYSF